MSIDCKELCERISKTYRKFMGGTLRDETAKAELNTEVEKAVKEFTADTDLELQRKAKAKSDAMYDAVKLMEEAMQEIDNLPADNKPGVAAFRIKEARNHLITSM